MENYVITNRVAWLGLDSVIVAIHWPNMRHVQNANLQKAEEYTENEIIKPYIVAIFRAKRKEVAK